MTTFSLYSADGTKVSGGHASAAAALSTIPLSKWNSHKAIPDVAPPASNPSCRVLTASFKLEDAGAIKEAVAKYAASLSVPTSDVNVTFRVTERDVIVRGRAQVVMSICGMVADFGHDGLMSVL